MTDSSHAKLVVAAQGGDSRAGEELIAAHLPLLYNIVRRALGGHADADDVVQETLLRVVRDLPALRDPSSFRSWMVAIAIRQIVSHRERQRAVGGRVSVVEEADELPDPGFEDVTILRMQVSGQRREVAEASRWLDEEHRLLLSLWWQESAGWLSRGDLAAALGLSVAHAGVKLQRMREQMELCREIVAALGAEPHCVALRASVEGWDGDPSPLWRKRIARHVRECETCLAVSAGRVPLDRLLMTFVPLAVPVGLAAAVAAKGLLPSVSGAVIAGGVKTSLLGKLIHAIFAHPVASLATGTAVVVFGSAVTMVTWPESPGEPPAVIAAPPSAMVAPNPEVLPQETTRAPGPRSATTTSAAPSATSVPSGAPGVPLGAWSLESVALPGQYLTYVGDFAALQQVSAASGDQAKRQATLTVMKGLADPSCVTFRATDGRYLRHMMLRLRLNNDEGTELFRQDATFCPRPGAVAGSVILQSHNYPGSVLHYRNGAIYLDGSDGTKAFARDSSFITRNPWTAAGG